MSFFFYTEDSHQLQVYQAMLSTHPAKDTVILLMCDP